MRLGAWVTRGGGVCVCVCVCVCVVVQLFTQFSKGLVPRGGEVVVVCVCGGVRCVMYRNTHEGVVCVCVCVLCVPGDRLRQEGQGKAKGTQD